MPARETHPACLELDALLQQCETRRTRGSGPGGQHRNKVESAIVITHLPTRISGQASERRSQHENRRQAIERLRINLAVGYRVAIGNVSEYLVSDLWQGRVISRRINISDHHDDFPAMLAEAMDVLTACQFDGSKAGKVLGCSATQLVKLLRKNHSVFEFANRRRAELELPPWR